ncbi:hypothetical protein ACVWW6_000567 [Bradyrhizobium sp. USDA 3311]
MAVSKPSFQRRFKFLRFLPRAAMADDVVGVAFERNVGIRPFHPNVEHVVQEQVCQDWTDGSLNANDNFRFERVIVGWRDRAVVDLRRKR